MIALTSKLSKTLYSLNSTPLNDIPRRCPSPCHPGSCPPCSAMGPLRTCGCGKKQYRLRCGEKDMSSSCGEQCGKLLSCGKHYCTELCHRDSCPPCDEYVQRRCYCTKTSREVRCGEEKEDRVSTQLQREIGQEVQKGYFSCEESCRALLVRYLRSIVVQMIKL